MGIGVSGEDYLETIYIIGKGEAVRSSLVAEALGVSRPAVNKAMTELMVKGFVEKHAYGKIMLTDSGKAAAMSVYSRHELLKRFLISIGVSETTAAVDCCKIEHFVSDETAACLADFMKTRD